MLPATPHSTIVFRKVRVFSYLYSKFLAKNAFNFYRITSVHFPLVMNMFKKRRRRFKLIPECGPCGKSVITRETSLPDTTAEHTITTYYSTEIQKSNNISSLVVFIPSLQKNKVTILWIPFFSDMIMVIGSRHLECLRLQGSVIGPRGI